MTQPFGLAAKRALRYPPVEFSGLQARAIARGFATAVERAGCILYACAIMRDHAHVVIARHRYDIQQVANLLKGAATNKLRRERLDPFEGMQRDYRGRIPSSWAHGLWKVWLDTPEAIERSIRYVNDNPPRARLRRQRWSCVTRYEPSSSGPSRSRGSPGG